MRVDTQTILTIHNSIITRWHRLSMCNTLVPHPHSAYMRLALKKHVSIRIGQNYDLGSHFLMSEFFQMKIFGGFLVCIFTFNSYLGTS